MGCACGWPIACTRDPAPLDNLYGENLFGVIGDAAFLRRVLVCEFLGVVVVDIVQS